MTSVVNRIQAEKSYARRHNSRGWDGLAEIIPSTPQLVVARTLHTGSNPTRPTASGRIKAEFGE
jgi:hypothetical protein